MSKRGNAPDLGTPQSNSSSEAIRSLLDEFTSESGRQDLVIRVVLINGETFEFHGGLRIESARTTPGLFLIRGRDSPARSALIVREENIVRLDIEIYVPEPEPPPKPPIGFSPGHASAERLP